MKYIFRVLALPFMLGLWFVTCVRFILTSAGLFLRYGGEFIHYTKDFNGVTIEKLLKNLG